MVVKVIDLAHPPFAPNQLNLSENELHVWIASLILPEFIHSRLLKTLSEDEIQRALRFKFEKDRLYFINARGMLRNILARYLAISPPQLGFEYDPHGKPRLMGQVGGNKIFFNLSHSGDKVVFAFVLNHSIGIDIELIRENISAQEIAARFFSEAENLALQALPDAQKILGFFHGWTRKEAFIKAMGDGLSYPLSDFDVTLVPHEPAVLLRVKKDMAPISGWNLITLQPPQPYVGALAVNGSVGNIKTWEWSV